MTETVDVSVVIVNWNTRDLLLGVIQSLLETTRRTAMGTTRVAPDARVRAARAAAIRPL